MSAELRPITNMDIWAQWENRVVHGVFPLRRFLGGSERSGVFLTEHKAKNLADVVIKFIPADAVPADAKLAQWQAASTLSHPNLVQIFNAGRYRKGGRDYLFVVMENADQTLDQILRRRPLNGDEVKEMLLPALDALAFLHRNQQVHGGLKPANFLAVGDQLKLASDTIRPASAAASGGIRTSAYDPPELEGRGFTQAGDIWSLGMTLAEALTQRTTAWPDETVSLPNDLPAPYATTVLRCLSSSPGIRPTIFDLESQYKGTPLAPPPPPPAPAPTPMVVAPSVQQPLVAQPPQVQLPVAQRPTPQTPPPEDVSSQNSSKLNLVISAAVVALLILITVWWLDLRSDEQLPPPPVKSPAVTTPAPVAPRVTAKPAPTPAKPVTKRNVPAAPVAMTPSSSSVLQDVQPDVPRDIQNRIRGRIHVTVRVLVDPNGDVMGTLLESAGPSKYFARLAEDTAGDWKFVPVDNEGTRVWILVFEFTRNGTSTRAVAQ